MLKNLWQQLDHYRCIETKCPEDATILKNHIKKDQVYDFLIGFNAEFNQVWVQILSKELPTLNETISIIRAKESRRSGMLKPQNMEGSTMVVNKGNEIIRLALLITKGLIGQRLQTVITGITYGALTVKNLDTHKKNVGNFMVSPNYI